MRCMVKPIHFPTYFFHFSMNIRIFRSAYFLRSVLLIAAFIGARSYAQTPASPDVPVTGKASETGKRTSAEEVKNTCRIPAYPPEDLHEKRQGVVTMEYVITAEGKVTKLALLKSSGSDALDKAAMASMTSCQFLPATLNGAPVEEIKKMDYVWKLDDTTQAATPPAMIPNTCQRPNFPLFAKPPQLKDSVVMSFIVGEDGAVFSEKTEQSSGSVPVDRAVLDSLLTCKFRPATLDGKPISRAQVIRYSLK